MIERILILTEEQATVAGNYGICNSLHPVELDDGRLYLPAGVLDCEIYAPAFDILKVCPVIDYDFFEVEL